MKKILPIVIIALLVAIVWLAFFWQPQSDGHQISQSSNGMPQGGDFVLQSEKGEIKLADYQGKVVLLYFGYTWCPDVCPTNLAMMAAALSKLDETQKAKVQGIFISVDPERDTVERLAEYSAFFHPDLLGATASPEYIKSLADRYGAVYRKVEQASATDYVVDHSSETYVVDPSGKLVERLPHAAPPADILKSIKSHW